jgi:putative uncharacterized protein gbs0377
MKKNDFYENLPKTKREQIVDWIISLKDLSFFRYLRKRVIFRKTLFAGILLTSCILLVLGGLTSPKRVTFKAEQLETAKSFANDSGDMELVSQKYSKENGIAVLEFETKDNTSAINEGIKGENLEWQLFFPPNINAKNAEMQVIPLTDNKISVVVKNIPENYGAFIVRATNNSPVDKKVDVKYKSYKTYLQEEKDKEGQNKPKKAEQVEQTPAKDNILDFYVTLQNDKLIETSIKDQTREEFALSIFNAEMDYQTSQVTRLEDAINTLVNSTVNDKKSIDNLKQESQYVVGDELSEKQDQIKTLTNSIDSKNKQIDTAKKSIKVTKENVANLQKNIKAVQDGTFQFKAPVRSVSVKID